MELNAEQIIRAFEVCRDKDLCNECPYEENIDCLRLREKHAIALMRSQEQRIKELTKENERLRKHEIAYDTPFSKQTMPNILSLEGDAAELYKQIEDKIKTDTVRKMQERLEELYTDKLITDDMTVSIGVIKQNIKDIAKEMLEGENESVDCSR